MINPVREAALLEAAEEIRTEARWQRTQAIRTLGDLGRVAAHHEASEALLKVEQILRDRVEREKA